MDKEVEIEIGRVNKDVYEAVFQKILNHRGWQDVVTPSYWTGPETVCRGKLKAHKISICTNVMDRLEDIRRTLPENIKSNMDYEKVEHLVLDYNSKDGFTDWVKKDMREEIRSGRLVVYRTTDPSDYSMAHSRNVSFKLASGDIVNNVDADNYTNSGFAKEVNYLANQRPEKAAFAKGKTMLRGRLGFYRQEFINLLGGYDEEITGYGHEDHDLLYRSYGLGFMMMYFGGKYCTLVEGHKKAQMDNFTNKNKRYTEKRNKLISFFNLHYGIFKANTHREWGQANVERIEC